MSELWSRRNLIATVIVGLLGSAITLGIFLYDSPDQEIGTQTDQTNASSESSITASPTISIFSIHISEVAMDIPAAFELGIQVGSRSSVAAHDIDVILDFGRAEIEVCDYTPELAVTNIVAEDKSHRRLEIEELQQEEKLHIRCLISSPVFDQVIISGGNIQQATSLDFEQYQASLIPEPVGFWSGVGRFFVIFFIAMFCFKTIGFLFNLSL